jgi:hypothetical protein
MTEEEEYNIERAPSLTEFTAHVTTGSALT